MLGDPLICSPIVVDLCFGGHESINGTRLDDECRSRQLLCKKNTGVSGDAKAVVLVLIEKKKTTRNVLNWRSLPSAERTEVVIDLQIEKGLKAMSVRFVEFRYATRALACCKHMG